MISDYLAGKVYDNLVGTGATITQPSTLYLAIFTTDPGTDASGTEASGGSYARKAVTFDDSATAGVWLNDAAITFDLPAGTFPYAAVFDAATAGNMLLYGSFNDPLVLASAGTKVISAGTMQFEVY